MNRHYVRNRNRKFRKIDRICLTVLGIAFFVFVVLNIAFSGSQSVSEMEKRELAKFPAFSFSSLADGSFTSGITEYFNDHFFMREKIIPVSKKIDTLTGINYKVDGADLVIINNDKTDTGNDGKLDDILNDLNKDTDTTAPATEPVTEPVETTPSVTGTFTLSKTSMKLTVGSGTTITVESPDSDLPDVSWSVDNTGVVEITSSQDNEVSIKAVGEGTAVLSCSLTGVADAPTCTFTVNKLETKSNGEVALDCMVNGLFIYGDAIYTSGFYDYSYFCNMADTAAYYNKLFSPEHMTLCVAPVSSIVLQNDSLSGMILDHPKAYAEMISKCNEVGVNCPDTCSEILAHRDEYLYFKTDHHWTHLGAYYGYKAFAESVGLTPVPLESFEKITLNSQYQGSMLDYTQDERVRNTSDVVDAYLPTKAMTMTVHMQDGSVQTYDSCVMDWSTTYSSFLCGDNPYTVINVPENPQDKTILVLKDSFGNAMCTFLSEHYGNIFIVDTRYADFNIKDQFSDYHFTDVLFINNIEAASSSAWPTMYLRAVGVSTD